MPSLWPEEHLHLSTTERKTLRERLEPGFSRLLQDQNLPAELTPLLDTLYLPLSAWLAAHCSKERPLLVGINGSQGSGKSTLCRLLQFLLRDGLGQKSCVISIDDLYLTHAERQQLARRGHPLLATRGVPGTHDVSLGLEIFDRLAAATQDTVTKLPRFDKASDDRFSEDKWERFRGRPAIILFEGWCVGATPQPVTELTEPVNRLEDLEDPAGLWRSYVNQQLAGPYRELFARLDLLLMLQVPDWQQVYRWRRKQEQQLLAGNPGGTGIMDDQALQRFIMHYERLTRHQLTEMPTRADLLLQLDTEQRITRIHLP